MNQSKSYLRQLFLFLFVLLCSGILSAQTLDELLNKGDEYLDVKYDNQKALNVYLKADSLFPNNWKIYWRLSRTYIYIGEKMPGSTDAQKDSQLVKYNIALDYANKAVKLAPNEAEPYLRRAIANGKIALFKGVFSVGKVVNAVKDDCEKAIKLGNGGNYTQAVAHYVLARTNAKVSEKWAPARAVLGLGWADIDTAIVEYNRAIKLYPNFRMFYLDLAKAYIREDEYDKARANLNKVLSSPKKDENDDKQLADAKILLKKIKDE